MILCGKTRIHQVPLLMIPLFQSSVIEHFQMILNDEWNNIVFQTFLEHNQSAHTTIPILKRVDALQSYMKIQNVMCKLSGETA